MALPDAYVEHGNVSLLREMLGIDSDSVIRRLEREYLGKERLDFMKERLDVLLVKRNLAESREKAKAVIMSGNRLCGRPEGGQGRDPCLTNTAPGGGARTAR